MIKLMIDSAADISKQEAEKLGIIMLSMIITIDNEEYYDGVNLLPNEFYEKLIECTSFPKTSLINAFRWEEAFKNNLGVDDEIIVITLSSKLSGTYQSAKEAAEKFNNRVHVIDSLNAAIGERLLCLYALRLIKEGLLAKEVVALVEEKKTKLKVIAMLGTLEYLKKGGRISSAVAFAGELISIKPVVGVVNGEVKLLGKAMGSKKSCNLLNKLIQESKGIDFSMPLGTLWSGLGTELLEKYIKDSATLWQDNIGSLQKYQLGATIGAHIGPNAVGVAFFEK